MFHDETLFLAAGIAEKDPHQAIIVGITAAGYGTFTGGIRCTSSSVPASANTAAFDYSGGGRFLGMGPDATTRGTFKVTLATSTAALTIDALSISNTGAATFTAKIGANGAAASSTLPGNTVAQVITWLPTVFA